MDSVSLSLLSLWLTESVWVVRPLITHKLRDELLNFIYRAMGELNEIEAKIRQGIAIIRTRPFDAELFISEALYMISLINERAVAESVHDASALPIHSVSGMCECDEPIDAGSDRPDVFHKCSKCGKYID